MTDLLSGSCMSQIMQHLTERTPQGALGGRASLDDCTGQHRLQTCLSSCLGHVEHAAHHVHNSSYRVDLISGVCAGDAGEWGGSGVLDRPLPPAFSTGGHDVSVSRDKPGRAVLADFLKRLLRLSALRLADLCERMDFSPHDQGDILTQVKPCLACSYPCSGCDSILQCCRSEVVSPIGSDLLPSVQLVLSLFMFCPQHLAKQQGNDTNQQS